MFKVLMPVDFSACSLNALAYARQMIKALNAELTLVHVLEPVGGDATMFVDGGMREEEISQARNKLNQIRADLIEKEHVIVNPIVTPGFPVEKILEVAEEEQISLIVMGTEGAGNSVQDILGSNTYNIVKKAQCAVLTVPIDARGLHLKKIGLAVSLPQTENSHFLTIIKHVAKYFNAEILLLHVSKEDYLSLEADANSDAVLWLSDQLKEFDSSFVTLPSGDIADAISDYAADKNIDLLAISPQKHNLLSQLLKRSTTRKLILHAHVPVLTLPAEF